MTSPRRQCAGARPIMMAAVTGVLAAAAGASRAQDIAGGATDGGPVVLGQRRTYEKFHLDRPTVGLSLNALYSQGEVRSGGVRNEFSQFLFTQSVDVATAGYFLSPNLFTLTLAGSAGVSESFAEGNDQSAQEIEQLYTWDVRGTLLPNSRNPVTAYTRREQTFINREFGETLRNTTTTTAAAVDLRGDVATHVEAGRIDSLQEGLSGIDAQGFETSDFRYTNDFVNWTSFAKPARNQTLNWNYSFNSIDQSGVTDRSEQTHDATLRHGLVFGKDLASTLDSTAHYRNTAGDFDRDNFRLDEVLRLYHSRAFQTRYLYTYDQTRFEGAQTTRHRGAAELTHRLYRSLVTTGRVGAQAVDLDGSEEMNYFGNVDFDYTKQVPYGQLNAGLGLGVDRTEIDGGGSPIRVVGDSRTFNPADPQPIVIIGTNIDPSTVLVRDASGLVLARGADYTVRRRADRIEIQRVLGGRIGSSDTVLLEYTREPTGDSTTTTTYLNSRARYTVQDGWLRGLSVYGQFSTVDQQIDQDAAAFTLVPNSYDDYLAGADYTFWNFKVGAEHQIHESQVNPFDANRVYGRYDQRLGIDTTASLTATYTNLNYDDTGERTDLYTVAGVVQHRFTPYLTGQLTVLYRDENDSLFGRTTGWEQEAELRFDYRQTTAYLQARNSTLDGPGESNSFQYIQIGIRRQF